jgi:hypothetical protein
MADNATPLKQVSELSSADSPELDGLEFDAIETAVLETPRGRWFLAEYARRVRAQDHDRIEAALARIEARISGAPIVDREVVAHDAAVTVPQKLVDLAETLRARGVDEQTCAHIEAQARALMDAASRRNLVGAVELLEKGIRDTRKTPAARS